MRPMYDVIFRCRERREAAGLSQSELGRRMGLSRATISQWESGINWPSARVLPQLAKELGCSIEELFRPMDHPAYDQTITNEGGRP